MKRDINDIRDALYGGGTNGQAKFGHREARQISHASGLMV